MGLSSGLTSSSDLRDTINFVTRGGYGKASGGTSSTISVGGTNYTLLRFTSNGTLSVSSSGRFDVCLVGGGGGGGGADTSWTGNPSPVGGGGGGQVIISAVWISAGQHSVIVGQGGSEGSAQNGGEGTFAGNGGTSSSIGTIISAGGGDSAQPYLNMNFVPFLPRPSSGTYLGTGGSGGAGIPKTQTGRIGINSGGGTDSYGGGGGGGAGSAGQSSDYFPGQGGNGLDVSSFIGGSVFRVGAGGGGSGSYVQASGGLGYGNYGSGGNAGQAIDSGGNLPQIIGSSGFSGVVYVRFL